MSIADNLRRVRERIARAAESSGRTANDILLLGVTKYVDSRAALELIAAGCTDLGESRPQELWKKAAAIERAGPSPPPSLTATPKPPPIHWHLIGHLQRTKSNAHSP